MTFALHAMDIRAEGDVSLARQRTREVATALGIDGQDRVRIAAAVSEVARNCLQHGGGGRMELEAQAGPGPMLIVRVADRGPGIADAAVAELQGRGLAAARRLADRVSVESRAGSGTIVTLYKQLPTRVVRNLAELARGIQVQLPSVASRFDQVAELRQENDDLIQTLDVVRERTEEVERLNRELDETNRGVLALYAELEERAQELVRASNHKSRFLSDMSHELRTPLMSILNVARLLVDRLDGPLTEEQDRQVRFIQSSAEMLARMVNDLLDLARIEAGKTLLRIAPTSVQDVFAALRGMFRPLALSEDVKLVFIEPSDVPPLLTDEGKLSQVLRNLVANALRFTERGEVRVSAARAGEGRVSFTVADTGIGIAAEDQERIFEEFTQLDHELQRRSKGTGLGLPLSLRLTELLRGTLTVTSALGQGSTFEVILPLAYEPETIEERDDA